MTIRTTASALLAALLLLAAVPAAVAAADADDDEAEEQSDGRWALSLATVVDQQSTRGFAGQLGYDLTKNTAVHFDADSTDYTATKQGGFKSQGVGAGVSHDFARFSLDGAIRHWQDTDIVTANEVKLGGDFDADPWSVGLRTGYRRAKFDPFNVTVTPAGAPKALSAVARCELDNTALGADGRYQGDVWGAYATAMAFHYADTDCRFNLSNGSALTLRQNRQQFGQLAAAQANRLTSVATRHIGRDEMLLDSYFDTGVSWKHDELVVSLDYSHQKEYFIGAKSNTYSVTGTADLGDHAGVDCTLGVTNGGSVTNGGFVGFAVRAKF